jgi:hypothetical protein
MDSDPDPAIFIINLQGANKKRIKKSFPAYYFLKVLLHKFFKDLKSKKKSQHSRNQGFSYYFCLMLEGSGPKTRGSRTATMAVRFSTAQNQINNQLHLLQ